jgi:branched-chain amino acid aminotransferase
MRRNNMGNDLEKRLLWLDGEVILQSKASVPASAIGVSASTAVFEGIRAYWNARVEQLYVFRLEDHFRRLANSMKLVWMEPRFSVSQLVEATLDLLRKNSAKEDTYIRVVAFQSGSGFFSRGFEQQTRILLEVIPLESHLGINKSMEVCVSSWTRIADNMMPPRIKAGGNYQNNRRAIKEAQMHGYDNAILLDARGKVTEASNACAFMIRGGVATTSPVTSGILESITRATLLAVLPEQLNLPVAEREIDRTELYLAEEAFVCGTGEEVVAIGSVDRFPLGDGEMGPITKEIESLYNSIVRGERDEYMGWCSPVW